MPVDAADRALLIDDASPDETTHGRARARPRRAPPPRQPRLRRRRRRPATCARCATAPTVIVMVHADNQYDPGLVAEMAAPILAGEADIVIGSRLLDDRAIAGGMPRWKWLGNRLLTGIENRAFGVRFSEYHTGYRAFSADFLRSIPFLRNSDDFVFDQEIFAQMLARGARVREIPIPTRYFHEASSRRLRDEPALRVQDAVGARRASGSTAAGRCCAAPPHGSHADAIAAAILARRAGDPRGVRARDAGLPAASTTRSTTTATRRRSPGRRLRARPTGARPRSARPRYPIFLAGVYRSFGDGARPGSRRRGSPTRSSGPGSSR